MNKIYIILPILVSLLTFSLHSNGEWTYVMENINGTEYYIDFDRFKKRDNYVYTWVLRNYLEPDQLGELSTFQFEKIHCGIPKKSKVFRTTSCDDNVGKGKCESHHRETEWRYPNPDSVMEEIIDLVCSQ